MVRFQNIIIFLFNEEKLACLIEPTESYLNFHIISVLRPIKDSLTKIWYTHEQ